MVEVEILEQKGHHFLWIDDQLWMWDLPEEVEYQREIAEKAFGDVLVAGYGFGLVQRFLLENPRVRSLLTIEQHPEVIEACRRHFGEIHGARRIMDFYEYRRDRHLDCIIGDIWRDAEPAYLPEYKRFQAKARELLEGNPNGIILGWGQDYMDWLVAQEENR